MIKRIYGSLPPDYPLSDVIVGRIYAYYEAYGTGYDFCTFYEGDGMLAMYYGGELYAYCSESFGDSDSLICFGETLGCNAILTNTDLGDTAEELCLMTARTKDIARCGSAKLTEDYKTVFGILKSGFDLSDEHFDSWYTDTCHMVRHGVSKMALATYDEAPAACGIMLYGYANNCYLSHIAVRKDMQKKGYGEAVVRGIANISADEYENAVVLCRDEICGFYRKIGFEKIQTFYEIRR